MPTGLYTRSEVHSESREFNPRQNKMRSFEIMVMSYIQIGRLQYKAESFYMAGTRKKNDAYGVDGFCEHRNILFEAMS